jgi:Ca2+-binding EF-hand superfamily protein
VQKRISENRATNVESLRKNYKSERTEELKEIFRMYDKTNVGYINQTVKSFLIQTLKFLLRGFGEYVDDIELSKRLQIMDEDGNGKIDSHEFLKYMMEYDLIYTGKCTTSRCWRTSSVFSEYLIKSHLG